jgi:hypothetical protein
MVSFTPLPPYSCGKLNNTGNLKISCITSEDLRQKIKKGGLNRTNFNFIYLRHTRILIQLMETILNYVATTEFFVALRQDTPFVFDYFSDTTV